jgi:hypothetical protein
MAVTAMTWTPVITVSAIGNPRSRIAEVGDGREGVRCK